MVIEDNRPWPPSPFHSSIGRNNKGNYILGSLIVLGTIVCAGYSADMYAGPTYNEMNVSVVSGIPCFGEYRVPEAMPCWRTEPSPTPWPTEFKAFEIRSVRGSGAVWFGNGITSPNASSPLDIVDTRRTPQPASVNTAVSKIEKAVDSISPIMCDISILLRLPFNAATNFGAPSLPRDLQVNLERSLSVSCLASSARAFASATSLSEIVLSFPVATLAFPSKRISHITPTVIRTFATTTDHLVIPGSRSRYTATTSSVSPETTKSAPYSAREILRDSSSSKLALLFSSFIYRPRARSCSYKSGPHPAWGILIGLLLYAAICLAHHFFV